MRAGSRMSQERADLVGRTGREDVLELAGLLLDLGFAVHGKAIGEKALGQAMTTNDAAGLVAPTKRKGHYRAAVPHKKSLGPHGIVTGIHKRPVIVALGRMRLRRHQ